MPLASEWQNSKSNGRNDLTISVSETPKWRASHWLSSGIEHPGERQIITRRSRYQPRSSRVRCLVSAIQASVQSGNAGNSATRTPHFPGEARLWNRGGSRFLAGPQFAVGRPLPLVNPGNGFVSRRFRSERVTLLAVERTQRATQRMVLQLSREK